MKRPDYATAVYIQAIKALGKDNITEQTIAHLKKFLNENQYADKIVIKHKSKCPARNQKT